VNSGPSNNPLVQQLQLLLTGYGYNFYNKKDQARADDILIRERASYFLAHAVELLAQVRSDYYHRFIPAPTRDNPFPSTEATAPIRDFETAQRAIGSLEAHIRAMPVPTQDRVWWRFRQEQQLLEQLLNFDLTLIRGSERIYQTVEQLTPEIWQSQGGRSLQQMTQQLARSAQERERFLLLQA
jgi:hypothetical protein